MPLLLPIKWFVIQMLAFVVMVVVEAGILHYIEGISKRDSMVYLLIVNLFSFSFGWLLVTIAFYWLGDIEIRDDILSYMLLGTVGEELLADLSLNPLANPLLWVMTIYFWLICFFELKFFTLLRHFILPTTGETPTVNLPIPHWLDWLLMVFLAKDLRLAVTLCVANFFSHVAVGCLIYLAQ